MTTGKKNAVIGVAGILTCVALLSLMMKFSEPQETTISVPGGSAVAGPHVLQASNAGGAVSYHEFDSLGSCLVAAKALPGFYSRSCTPR